MSFASGLEPDSFMCNECSLPFPIDDDEGGELCGRCLKKFEAEEQAERESDHKREVRP